MAQLFRTRGGVHTDCQEQARCPPAGPLWPRGQWHEFYEPYQRRTPPAFSANEVLGGFER